MRPKRQSVVLWVVLAWIGLSTISWIILHFGVGTADTYVVISAVMACLPAVLFTVAIVDLDRIYERKGSLNLGDPFARCLRTPWTAVVGIAVGLAFGIVVWQ